MSRPMLQHFDHWCLQKQLLNCHCEFDISCHADDSLEDIEGLNDSFLPQSAIFRLSHKGIRLQTVLVSPVLTSILTK